MNHIPRLSRKSAWKPVSRLFRGCPLFAICAVPMLSFFMLSVARADPSDYIIRVNYNGPLILDEVEVLLYDTDRACDTLTKHSENPPSDDVAWADLIILANAAGEIPEQGINVPSTVELHYAVARGKATDSAGEAKDYFATFGCNDQIPEPAPDSAAVISISMDNLWPETAGSYLIYNRFEPLSGFSQLAWDASAATREFMSDPGLGLLRLIAIAGAGEQYWQVEPWNKLFREIDLLSAGDQLLPTVRVIPTGRGRQAGAHLERHIDANIAAQLGGREQNRLRLALRDGREALFRPRAFTLAGGLFIEQNPDEAGLIDGPNQVILLELEWQWADKSSSTILRSGYYIEGLLSAGVVFHPEYTQAYSLFVEPYELSLSYGSLLTQVLESVVFPETLNAAIDSMEEFFGAFVDCADLPSAWKIGCMSLHVDAGESLMIWNHGPAQTGASYAVLSTPPDNPCRIGLQMQAGDLLSEKFVTQRFGGPTESDRCVWHGEVFSTGGQQSVELNGEWWGELLE